MVVRSAIRAPLVPPAPAAPIKRAPGVPATADNTPAPADDPLPVDEPEATEEPAAVENPAPRERK